jgi:hypothetical protein|tara:strand:- start:280 stop:462 length:183 start_codon:yes stop_codon:yes gene_type:complete
MIDENEMLSRRKDLLDDIDDIITELYGNEDSKVGELRRQISRAVTKTLSKNFFSEQFFDD